MSESETMLVAAGGDVTVAELAKALLELADNPADVVWRPRQNGFEVPTAVAEAYGSEESGEDSEESETPPAGAPQKRQPRKAVRAPRKRAAKKDEGGVTNA